MEKPKIQEVIAVEGRYDKNTLLQVVDASVLELGGFGIFNDRERTALLRRLAETRGIRASSAWRGCRPRCCFPRSARRARPLRERGRP